MSTRPPAGPLLGYYLASRSTVIIIIMFVIIELLCTDDYTNYV